MFGTKNKKEKLIMLAINTSKNIKYLYDNMNIQNKDKLEKELKAEITKENFILDALNIHESNAKEIYKDYVNTLNESLIDDFKLDIKDEKLKKMFNEYIKITNCERIYINDLVLKRFESYLIKEFKSNPTESLEKKNNSIRRKENRAMITHSAIVDYHTNVVRFLTELEENTDSISIANKAIEEKNRLLFTDMFIEEKYLNNDLSAIQYEKCICNGFNEEYVDEIYKDAAAEITNEQARACYLYSNKTIENKSEAAKLAVNLEMLKAGLYLLDTDTLKLNLNNYYKISENSGKKSAKMIYQTMLDTIQLKDYENNRDIKIKKLTS